MKGLIAFVKNGCLYLVHLIMPAGTRLHTVTSLHMLDYTIRTSCAAKHRLKSANGKYSRYKENKQVIDLIFSLKQLDYTIRISLKQTDYL